MNDWQKMFENFSFYKSGPPPKGDVFPFRDGGTKWWPNGGIIPNCVDAKPKF